MAQQTINLEREDMQGLLIRGHSELPSAAFLLLRIDDAHASRIWLQELLPHINKASEKTVDFRLHIAVTWSGLKEWGANEFYDHGFLVEFLQGMTTEYRQRILGDQEQSAPQHWEWGAPGQSRIDVLLLAYAGNDHLLEQRLQGLKNGFESGGLTLIKHLDTKPHFEAREHFGFRDGVAQPIVKELSRDGPPENIVAAGEFFLGYPNAYNEIPLSPKIKPTHGLQGYLPDADFGRNGSYLVFRHLQQDVAGFWGQIRESCALEGRQNGPEDYIKLASKMFGRWPNGAPLVKYPEERPGFDLRKDDFQYQRDGDVQGFKCPLGSHIRRANPRDAMPGVHPKKSIAISNRHRIIRRGRPYGPPLTEDLNPVQLSEHPDDGQDRGLHFICFNTNIARQFEFIQHTWSNNIKFSGLYKDPDPILGIKREADENEQYDFTIQAEPIRRKVRNITRHVHVRGGAYFFMPGIRALHFLANFVPS